VPPKRPAAASASVQQLKPLLKPIVEPVLARLDRHEALLEELKTALEIQFRRTAEVQAQLDKILSTLAKSSQ
jgi:hypothetical protein